MIISHKYKFIYFKAVKVAGTSTEIALAENCGLNDVVTTISPPYHTHKPRNFKRKNIIVFRNHMDPEQVKNLISAKTWNTYLKVAVVRNPWDVMVSRYWHYHGFRKTKRGEDLRPFSEWLAYSKNAKYINTKYYFDKEGDIICDFYIRFENLVNDIYEFCNIVNMPHPIEIPKTKHNIRLNSAHYSSYYSLEDIEIVRERAKIDIDFFGYRFEHNND